MVRVNSSTLAPACFHLPEEAQMHAPQGPLLGIHPGDVGSPARSQQLLLLVLRARGALAYLLVPLVGEGFHLDAPMVEVLRQNTSNPVGQGQGKERSCFVSRVCVCWGRGVGGGRVQSHK